MGMITQPLRHDSLFLDARRLILLGFPVHRGAVYQEVRGERRDEGGGRRDEEMKKEGGKEGGGRVFLFLDVVWCSVPQVDLICGACSWTPNTTGRWETSRRGQEADR
jgi:hypothetical protein